MISGQLSQGQRGSHTIHRVWETLEVREFYEKQIFSVYELSQEIFLLFNFLLCSLMCEMYITLQWCFSAHRDKGKTFWFFFFLAVLGVFPVWPFLYLRQVGATLCLQGAWLLIAVASFVVEHRLKPTELQ